MSDVHNTAAPVEAPVATEPVVAKPEETTAAEEIAQPEVAATESAPIAAETTTEAPATETPAVEAAAVEETPAEAAATEETPAATSAAETKPIESGVIGYKAPGLIKSLKFSKRFFYFSEEAIPTSNLSNFLRGEKPETGHAVAAWSSQTGKGLLYYVKHAEDDKTHPVGVLHLADASDLEKASPHEFTFKLQGHKHAFKATTDEERDGWYVAVEKAISEAKASKETITSSEGYKEALASLGKAPVAAGVGRKSTDAPRPATSSSSDSDVDEAKKAKKSRSASRGKRHSIFGQLMNKKEEHDVKKEEKKEEKAEAKEEKAEEKTEEPATEAVEATEPAAAPLDAEATAARVVEAPVDEAKPVEETPALEAAPVEEAAPAETTTTEAAPVIEVPVAESAGAVEVAAAKAEAKEAAEEKPVEEKKVTEERPKTTKRSSIFGAFFDKVRSPTSEKKEADVTPVVPPKETVVSAEPPVLPEPATSAPLEATTETPAEATEPIVEAPKEAAVENPTKIDSPAATPSTERKQSFFGSLVNKARAKSPANMERAAPATTEAAPAVPPKDDEAAPIAAAEGEASIAPTTTTEITADKPAEKAVEESAAPAAIETPKAATPKENRRKSYFGAFGGAKKDKTDAESPSEEKSFPSKITSMFRSKSMAVRPKKENAAPVAADKPSETTPAVESTPVEPVAEENKATEAPAAAETAVEEPKAEVVPEAATEEQTTPANPTVSAAA